MVTDEPEQEVPPSIAPESRPRLDQPSDAPRLEKSEDAPARKPRFAWLRELAVILALALALSTVIKTYFFQSFFIPSESMEATLQVDDRIIVNKMAESEDDLRRGDIVVFVDPGGWLPPNTNQPTGVAKVLLDIATFVGIIPMNAGEHMVKRIIGMPGDHVTCCGDDGLIWVNGVPVTETYLAPGMAPSDVSFDVVVPEGGLWVMGDNRSNSRDSRAHLGDPGGGIVPIAAVEGKAVLILFPIGRFGTLSSGEEAFLGVPAP